MPDVSLKIKVQSEGQQQLAATKDAVLGVSDSVRKADAALGSFDASQRKLSPVMRQLRKEMEDADKAAEKYIKTLERQAQFAGKTASQRLNLREIQDIAEFGNTPELIKRIEASYAKLRLHAGPLPPPLPKEAAESSIASLAKIGLQFEAVRRVATTAATEIGDAITKADQVSRLDRTLTRLSGGNKSVGLDLRRRIQDVAIESQAFDFDTAREAAQRLAAFKLPLQELPGILTAIGDKAAEIGRDKVPAIVRALGQINVKGRVQAEELLQLQEAGIDATATLAKGFGLTTQKFLKDVEKGIIPAREAIRLLVNDMRTGAGKDIPEVGAKVDQLREKYDRFKSDFAAEFVNPPLLRLLENSNTLLDHLIKKGREFAATFDKDRGAGAAKDAVTASLTATAAANPLTAAIAVGGAIINYSGERLKATPRTTSQDLANAARYGAFESTAPLKPYANAEADARKALERERLRIKSEHDAEQAAKQAIRNAKQVADDIERIEERALESQLNRADKLRAERDKEVRDLTRLGATRAQIDRARLAYSKLISDEEALIANRSIEYQRESFAKLAQEIEQAATRARDKASSLFSDKLGKSISFDEAEVRRLTRILNQDDDFAAGAIERRSQGARRLSDALAPTGAEKSAALANLQIELDKVQRILEIRLNGAQRIQDAEERSLRVAELKEAAAARADEARLETAARLIELDKQRSERYREDAGRVFDAISSRGGGGLRDFLSGFVKQQERAVFQNISQGIFERAGGILGKVGQASGLGGLLRGTIFDPQNAQTPEMRSREKNTLAIERNTAAIQGRVSITGNSGIDSILSQIPGTTPSFARGSRSTGGGFLSGVGSLFSGGLFRGLRGGDYSVTGPDGRTTTASALGLTSTSGRVGNVVGSAALVGAGAYGITSGVKQGGAQGALTAIQGGLSIAAAVPGPQQPFIQAAALVAGLVKGLFPDSKQQREQEISDEIAKRRSNAPSTIDRVQDRDGNSLDYDANGNLRRAGGVTININAIDAKSLIERSGDFAAAITKELRSQNEALRVGIQKSVFGVA